MKPRHVVLPCALLLLLAACAGAGSSTTPGPDTSGSGSSSKSQTAAPGSPTADSAPPTSPGGGAPAGSVGSSAENPSEAEDLTLLPTEGAGATMTLSGIPTAGVEARCWLLDGYLLVGVPTELLDTGQPITVTGRAEPGLMTTCQQGIPLRVESAVPA